MADMIGGIAGAAGSIVGGVLGAQAADRAANMNWQINLMNYYQRERERKEAMRRADVASAEQKLGSADIRGTTTKFVPGKGWVVTGAADVMEMMKLQDQAQKDVLTKDIPMRRKAQERNYIRGLQDEGLAETFRKKLSNVYRGSDEAVAADLYRAMSSGIGESNREMSRKLFTQGMRTQQNSNFGRLAGSLADASNEAYSRAALNARMQARGKADEAYNQERGANAQLYNMFAQRAGQLPDANYRPQAFNEGDTANASAQSLQAMGMGAQFAAQKGGTLDYIQPNYGWANAIGGAGNAIGSLGRMFSSQGRRGGGSGGGGGASGGGLSEGGVTGFGSTSTEGSFMSTGSSDDYSRGGY